MGQDVLKLVGEKREKVGTSSARKARKEGKILGNIYGEKKGNLSISFSEHDFLKARKKGARCFEIDIAGAQQTVLVKKVQYDYLGTNPIHVDFIRTNLDAIVEVNVKIILKGEPKGLANNGQLKHDLHLLKIKCAVRDIPNEIIINISDLDVNENILGKDVKLPENTEIADQHNLVVVHCAEMKQAKTRDKEDENEEGETVEATKEEGEKTEEEKKS
jgi:large subunit ribosomal protein L25